MNFLLKNKHELKVYNISDVDIAIGNSFLNQYSFKQKKRNTIIDATRTLTYFYVWLDEQGLLNNVDTAFIQSKRQKDSHNSKFYYESLFNPILPKIEKPNKIHMLPIRYVPLFIEMALIYAHPIALGIYFQFFGGLRTGEVVNLKRTEIKKRLDNLDFLLKLKENNLRTDLRDSSGGDYVKKNRTQIVFQINDWGTILQKEHINHYQKLDVNNTEALFINRDGKPMSRKSYDQYFYKLKNKFIDFLLKNGTLEDKIIAMDLKTSNWGTHIGRGSFTNFIAEQIDNPAELMFLRNDSSLESSLPYLIGTNRVKEKVQNSVNNMHTNYLLTMDQRLMCSLIDLQSR